MKRTILTLAAVLGLGASSASAGALCLPGPNTDGLAITDVTLNNINATNCYGVVAGNNSGNTDINSFAELEFGDAVNNWGVEIKDDSPGGAGSGAGNFFGVNWTLSSPEAGKVGTWDLSFVDTNPTKLDFTADILVVLKASDRFAAYYFDDFLFDSTMSDGDWKVGFKKGKNIPDLSHISVYFRDANACDDCGSEQHVVPEPASLALLGTALFGVGFARRRRRQ